MAKAIFSVDRNKVHCTRQFNGKFKHNHRINHIENADPSKTHLNENLIPLQYKTYTQAYNERIKSLPYYKTHAVRSDIVRGIEVVLQIGSRGIPKDFDMERWKQENVNWLKKTFGEENVIDAVLHMDETTPHIHAMIIPVVDGKLNAKKLIGGPAGLRKHQESYAKAMVPLGLEARTKYSVAKHEDIKKFYTAINDAIVEKLPAPLQHESVEDYFERAQGYFEKRNLQNLGKQRELEHMIIDAKNSHIEDRMDYVHLMSELENMRQMMGDNIEEMRKKIKLMDYINAGLKLHPSKEFAQATKDAIQELVQIAKDHELEQEQNESTALRG